VKPQQGLIDYNRVNLGRLRAWYRRIYLFLFKHDKYLQLKRVDYYLMKRLARELSIAICEFITSVIGFMDKMNRAMADACAALMAFVESQNGID